MGAWGVVPLVAGEYGKSTMDNAEVGLRYSTPAFTAGAIVSPASGVLNQIWMVRGLGRSGSAEHLDPYSCRLSPSLNCTYASCSAVKQRTQLFCAALFAFAHQCGMRACVRTRS